MQERSSKKTQFALFPKTRVMLIFLRIIGAVYLVGALVHLSNILSLTGRVWAQTPLSWRLLDTFYLPLDLAVAVGLFLKKSWGVIGLLVAAVSQLILYVGFGRSFTESESDGSNILGLIVFHIVTLGIYSALLYHSRRNSDSERRG